MITLEQLQAGIVIPVDKPRQWTSFQAVSKIKAAVRNTYLRPPSSPLEGGRGVKPKIKIGHAGTLDPLATGLLLVCLGKATKSIPQLQEGDKVYTGTMVFGATTPCYDLERPVDAYFPYSHITRELLQQEAQRLTGTLMQVPPIFSAVKVGGQRAYEIGRQQAEGPSPLTAKKVQVYSFEITAFRPGEQHDTPETAGTIEAIPAEGKHLYNNPLGEVPAHLPQADFRIHCGKGTYIRSLARDLGQAVGSGAFLSALRREQIGTFHVADALQLDQVEDFISR